MNWRRTPTVESASRAPEPVVAAIRPRQLARSGNSPCHEYGKPRARSRWATAERRRGAGHGHRPGMGPGHRCPLPPESHRAPAWSMEGGGSRLALAAPADQRSAHGPAANRGASPRRPSRRRGKPGQVEHREDRSRRCVQRRRLSGFPARGVAREAQNGRRGAPCFSGARAVSRRPNGRPGVQPGKRPCCPSVAMRPFVSPVCLPS